MKKKLFSIVLIFLLLLFSSCHKKQDSRISTLPSNLQTEKQTESATENRNASKKWIKSDFKIAEPVFLKNKSTNISDPYKEFTTFRDASSHPMLDRFYQDLDDDGIPELLLEWNAGTSGGNYSIFKIKREGYQYLGSIFVWSFSSLKTKHYGFHDLMMFSRLWDLDGDIWGRLDIYEFNGIKYEPVKMMDIGLKDSIKEKIFIPDSQDVKEEDFNPRWSIKDDDKYRRMIK